LDGLVAAGRRHILRHDGNVRASTGSSCFAEVRSEDRVIQSCKLMAGDVVRSSGGSSDARLGNGELET
jgi:hypothetical protein